MTWALFQYIDAVLIIIKQKCCDYIDKTVSRPSYLYNGIHTGKDGLYIETGPGT